MLRCPRRTMLLRPLGVHRRGESGVATIWAVTWIFVITSVGWLGVTATSITSRQHQLDGAADLVSVSAAARLQRGGEPCALAAGIALANRVSITSCQLDGSDVVVTVATTIELPFGVDGGLTASARAGP